MENYADYTLLFKALADETRLKIIDMLSGRELYASEILKSFDITQPTLSYHMRILTESGIVTGIREGTWIRYTIKEETVKDVSRYWKKITKKKIDCQTERRKKNGTSGQRDEYQ